MTETLRDAERVQVKLFAEGEAPKPLDLIPVFHRWIQDDVVKDDVKASDDEGWYDVVSTEKAILTRLAEELFDDVVEDTVLSLMFGK